MEINQLNTIQDIILSLINVLLLPLGVSVILNLETVTTKFGEFVHKRNILKTPETSHKWNKKIIFMMSIVAILGGVLSLIPWIYKVIRF